MSSISTNSFDLMKLPRARYAEDNGKPVLVVPLDDPDFFRISNKNGCISITCPIMCQEKFNKPTTPNAPTHDFMQNITKEKRQEKIAIMLKHITEHPEKTAPLVTAYTDLTQQPDGSFRYVRKDGTVGDAQTPEQIAAAITYGRITFGPGWVLRKEAPKPTSSVSIQQPAQSSDEPYSDCPF